MEVMGGDARSIERTVVAVVCLALVGSCAGVALAAAAARGLEAAPLGAAVIGAVIGAATCAALGRRRLAARLPEELDGWFRRRRGRSAVWFVVAALAVGNTARLGLFVAEPDAVWASAFPIMPESATHHCFAAYVRAGELASAGQADLWRDADYAARAVPPTEMRGMAPFLGDPYEYPPTFAVLPRAAVAATDDYHLLRALWFGLSAVGFWLAFLGVALWMRGRAGATALLFAPIVALSFPLTMGLQYGQAHLLVVSAAVGAMLCFERGRRAAGGALLAAAIASKIFPGLLLVYLAVRRRWRDLAATLAALAALVGLAAIVLGPATLEAFVTEHLPRMSSGEAFGFTETNADNHAPYGIAFKLRSLGVEGAGREVGAVLAWVWGVLALVLTALAARRRAAPDREALLWLGILCAATLRSPFAPMYTAIGSLWLLAIALGVARPRRWLTTLVVIAWVLLQGVPLAFGPAGNALASLPSQIATIAIALAALWPRQPRSSIESPVDGVQSS